VDRKSKEGRHILRNLLQLRNESHSFKFKVIEARAVSADDMEIPR